MGIPRLKSEAVTSNGDAWEASKWAKFITTALDDPDSDDDDAGIGGDDQGEPESDKRRAESPPDGPAPRASKSRR